MEVPQWNSCSTVVNDTMLLPNMREWPAETISSSPHISKAHPSCTGTNKAMKGSRSGKRRFGAGGGKGWGVGWKGWTSGAKHLLDTTPDFLTCLVPFLSLDNTSKITGVDPRRLIVGY